MIIRLSQPSLAGFVAGTEPDNNSVVDNFSFDIPFPNALSNTISRVILYSIFICVFFEVLFGLFHSDRLVVKILNSEYPLNLILIFFNIFPCNQSIYVFLEDNSSFRLQFTSAEFTNMYRVSPKKIRLGFC